MAYKIGIDEINTPQFDSEEYIQQYFKPMRISKERKKEREEASRDFRDVILFLFALIAAYSDFPPIDWKHIEHQYRMDFERAALRYSRNTEALQGYIDEKTAYFINITRDKDLSDIYWTSEERATMEAVNDANDVVGYEEWQTAIEEGKSHKIWKTERDNRVRHSHRAVDGKKLPITEMFVVGDSLMRFPHDTYYGTPAQTVNCRCSCEYVGSSGKVNKEDRADIYDYKTYTKEETLNRARSINSIDDLRNVSNSSIINMTSTQQIVDYFKKTHGIEVKGFLDKNLFGNKATLAGLDDMLNEFPEIKKQLTKVEYSSRLGYMGDYTNSGIMRVGYSGLKDYGTGVHEAAHALDYVRKPFGEPYSDKVVEQARINLKLRKNGKEYRELVYRIVGSVKDANNPREVFAYSMETAKGGVENELASEIYRIVKEGF